MFLGEFNHTIDGKGRLTLPAKFRAELSPGVVVTRGIERCLFIYTKNEWERFASQVTGPSVADEDVRDFGRYMFSGANACEPDRQGRILLPGYLREYANLNSDVVIIGVGTRLEVWNPAAWRERLSDLEANAPKTAGRLARRGIL